MNVQGPSTDGANAPLVSIVIGNWNRLFDVKRAVQSIRDQPYKNKEIIIVDNKSTDGSVEWCREQPDVTLIIMRCDLGASAMLDTGFLSANGKYVVCMDNDGELVGNAIHDAVEVFEHFHGCSREWPVEPEVLQYINSGYKIGCITTKMFKGKSGKQTDILDMKAGLYKPNSFDTNLQFHGAACFFSKEAGDSVGWYNPEYFLYHNEVDLGARLYKNGYLTLYVPYIHTVHHISETGRVRPRLLYYAIRHYYWFIWEHLPLHLALYHSALWIPWSVMSAWRYPRTLFMSHLSAFARLPWVLMRRSPIKDKRMTRPWAPNLKKELNVRRWLELIFGEDSFGTKIKK